MQTLDPITNLQKRQGAKIVCQDINGNVVSLPNGQLPIPAFSQNNVASVANMAAVAGTTIPNSEFTFDVIGGPNPSDGALTIDLQTHKANGTQGFTEDVAIMITLDPSIPGDPAQLVVTDQGTVVSQ
jgi:hypothetical protein